MQGATADTLKLVRGDRMPGRHAALTTLAVELLLEN
jgi:hypothetical protein